MNKHQKITNVQWDEKRMKYIRNNISDELQPKRNWVFGFYRMIGYLHGIILLIAKISGSNGWVIYQCAFPVVAFIFRFKSALFKTLPDTSHHPFQIIGC
jgi:hypothetical protein